MKQHHVLVVGVGSIGERHVRCFLATNRAHVSIVELNADLRRQVAERYQATPFESLESALQSAPDVAVVSTPAPSHIPISASLVAAGVHVLIEKPLSTSLEGIARLEELAQARERTLGVAYVLRAFPEIVALRERLRSGEFGLPLELTMLGGQHFPTYRPAYRQIYYTRRETGGGAVQDALTHMLNLGEWLVGPIERLVCDAAHLALPGVEIEDTVHLLARHRSGPDPAHVLASYALNQHQAPNETLLQVACERGTIRCELHSQRLLWMTQPGEDWQTQEFGPRERDVGYIAQANAFLDAIEQGAPPACSLAEGLQTLRVNLAALRSIDSRAWELVDGEPT